MEQLFASTFEVVSIYLFYFAENPNFVREERMT
jgi:hypothetical protein